MRSFANYRWILAVTVAVAVLAVLFYRPRPAEAQGAPGPGGTPTGGTGAHPCLRGEGASAPKPGGTGSCYYCRPPPPAITPGGGGEEEKKGKPKGPITPYAGGRDRRQDAVITPGGGGSGGAVITPYAGGRDRRDSFAGSSTMASDVAAAEPGTGGCLDPHAGSFSGGLPLPSIAEEGG